MSLEQPIYFKSLANKNFETKDVVIVSVPWVQTTFSLMAPAALKPVVEKAGFTCLALDINGEVQHLVQSRGYSIDQLNDIENFFFENYCNEQSEILLLEIFGQIARQITSFNPKYVGLSALAYPERNSIKWIAYFIKKIDPNIKIIIGGAGVIGTNFTGRSEFVDELISSGIVDYHIRGDGEIALYELLRGNTDTIGINSIDWQELSREELAKVDIPDYSDYHLEYYPDKYLGILGSRGCVRACTYCDYIENWKKFTWRSADDIFNEMIHQSHKHGVRYFMFRDALVNGNVKEFNRMLELISEYNTNNPEKSLSWSGMCIFRNVTASSQREWELLAKSGASGISVGVESLSEHVRYHMGKKFSNESLEFHLEQAKKHKIRINLLMIVGYVTETAEDIEYAKKWLIENVRFRDTIKLSWGSTLGILENTYLLRNEKKLGIKIHALGPYWVNESIGSTPETRITWLKDIVEFSEKLGYIVEEDRHRSYVIKSVLGDES